MFAVLLSRSVALAVPLDGSRPLFLEWTGCLRDGCTPFDDERGLAPSALVLTAGYVFSAATLAPLGFVSLRENMLAQKFSFVLLIVLCAIFLGSFGFTLGDGAVAAVGPKSWDVLGVVIFNFAFCVTVPSWLNENDNRSSSSAASSSTTARTAAVGSSSQTAFRAALSLKVATTRSRRLRSSSLRTNGFRGRSPRKNTSTARAPCL